MSTPAAWHPDPTGRHEYRYWDGERWSDHVADAGQVASDPVDGGATAAAAGSGEGPGSGADDPGWADGRDADATTPGAAGGTGSADPGWQRPESGDHGANDTGTSETAGPPSWGDQGQRTGQWQGDDWQQGGSSTWSQHGGQPAKASNGMAIAALIVGILSLLVSFIPFIGLIAVIGGIVAAVLGFIGRGKAKRGEANGAGMALAGIITGIVSLVLSIAITVALVSFGNQLFGESFGNFQECLDSGRSEAECETEFERDLTDQFS